MVFFTCNGCGESLKKNQVDKHRFKCRNSYSLTCIDCLKDFHGQEYAAHLKCISENEKYGGANYVAKENKGEVKQEKWVEQVQRAIDEASKWHNRRLVDLLEQIRNYPNVPRKEAKFKNFLANSLKIRDQRLVGEAWSAITSFKQSAEHETNDEKTEKTDQSKSNDDEPTTNNDQSECEQQQQTKKSSKKSKKSDSSSAENVVGGAESVVSDDQSEAAVVGGAIEPIAVDQSVATTKKKRKRQKSVDQSETTAVENGHDAAAEVVDQSETAAMGGAIESTAIDQSATTKTKKRKRQKSIDQSAETTVVVNGHDASAADQSETAAAAMGGAIEPIAVVDQSAATKKKRKRQKSIDQSAETTAVENGYDASAEVVDQSETALGGAIDQSATKKRKRRKSVDDQSETTTVENGHASVETVDQSENSAASCDAAIDQSESPPPASLKLKSIVKKLVKQADAERIPLKRLKKLTAKSLGVVETPEKMKIYSEIDQFLRKNAQKYVVDGKLVKFALEN